MPELAVGQPRSNSRPSKTNTEVRESDAEEELEDLLETMLEDEEEEEGSNKREETDGTCFCACTCVPMTGFCCHVHNQTSLIVMMMKMITETIFHCTRRVC